MSSETYTIADYLNAFQRRRRVFFLVFLVIVTAAILAAVIPEDYYRSSAELRIDLEGPNIDLLEPVALTNYADQYIKTLEQNVITNDNLRTWLKESQAFRDDAEEMSEGELIREIRDNIRIQLVFTSVIEERSGKSVELITGFRPVFTADSPEAAHSVAENLASEFLAEDRASRTQQAAAASRFLREQIEAKRQEIADLEEKIAEFKEDNAGKLPELLFLNMTVLERTERDLEDVQSEIQALEEDRVFRQSQLQEIRQNSASAERLQQLEDEYLRAISLYGPDHPDVIRIRRQVAALTAGGSGAESSLELQQLQAQLAEAREKYSDEHPDVKILQRRIRQLESGETESSFTEEQYNPRYLQLRAQINAIDIKIDGLEERESALRQKLEETEAKIANTPQVERRFQALDRDLQTAKLAFEDLRQRLAQAQQTESFEAGELGARLAKVSSASVPDEPAGPKRLAITLLGIFVATSLAGGAAIARELLDSTIRGRRDIRTVLGADPIVSVPVIENSVVRTQRRRQFLVSSFGLVALVAILILASSRAFL